MLDAFFWWLTFLLLGLAALPITLSLFRHLPDRGYGFSRALGLLLFGYLFWLLGTARILPNSQAGAIGAFAIVLAFSSVLLYRRRRALLAFFQRRWGMVLATELVFGAVFVIWGVLRSYSPEIAHTEQPMDFALLNAILVSPNFPPNDPWFAGEPITYYYFGYLMSAGVSQLTGIGPEIAYNLSLMAIAGMAAAGIMSLVYNLVMSVRGPDGARAGIAAAMLSGGAAVILLLFMGNLVGLLEFVRVNELGSDAFWSWIAIDGLDGRDRGSSWFPSDTWWWWRSTRVINTFVDGGGIDYTITEFPFFSFMLGDLHPHVMSMPFVLLAIALSFNLLRSPGVWGLPMLLGATTVQARAKGPFVRFAAWWLAIFRGLVVGRRWDVAVVILALGALGFLNSWDLPTFTALFFAALLLRAFQVRAAGHRVDFKKIAGVMAVIVAGAGVLYLPFYVVFDSQAAGVLPVREAMTRQIHYVLIWGPFLLLNLSLLAALAWSGFREPLRRWALRRLGAEGLADEPPDSVEGGWRSSPAFWAVALPLVPFAIWAGIQLGIGVYEGSVGHELLSIGSRFWHLLPLFLILSIGLGLLFRKAAREGAASASAQFVLLLMLFGFLLTLGSELFRIVDLFNNRMNTVFKFYYQAWVLLSVGGAFSLYYWGSRRAGLGKAARWGWSALIAAIVVVIAAAFMFVPAAAYSKAERFDPSPTLNAFVAYQNRWPQEYEAVRWLQREAERGSVIVEAVPLGADGRPQGDYDPLVSRISRMTGLPAVLGWPGHEHQWRGDPFDPIAERARDVDTIYRGQDLVEAQRALDRYDVTYVIVGDLERRTYGPEVVDRFAAFMDIAYENEGVVIYTSRASS